MPPKIIANKIYKTIIIRKLLFLLGQALFSGQDIKTPPYTQAPKIITKRMNNTNIIAEDEI